MPLTVAKYRGQLRQAACKASNGAVDLLGQLWVGGSQAGVDGAQTLHQLGLSGTVEATQGLRGI